jgi:branched-chain amino acid transport system permease protein
LSPVVRTAALGVLIAIVAIGLPFVVSGYQALNLAEALIYAIAILGLNILTGYSGQISLGHGAFVAVGAFVAAITIQRWNLPWPLTLPLAAAVSGLVGFVLGIPALRLEGVYLALATFALGVAAPTILQKPSGLTGGVRGIILPPLTSPTTALGDEQFFYFVCLLVAALLFVVAWNLLRGRTGRALRAIRDGEVAARAFGVDLPAYKTLAFAVSAAYAGIAGALLALAITFVSASGFQFTLSIYLLIGAIIGGLGTLEGPIFGGLFVWYLPIASQQMLPTNIANAAPYVTQGVVLLIVMFVARQGIAGLLRRGYYWLRLNPIPPTDFR